METTLLRLADHDNLTDMLDHLTAVPRPQAIEELLERDGYGRTALIWVSSRDPSLELVRAIWDVMKDDPLKTNLLAITDEIGWYPLHCCAFCTTSVEVLQFVIDRFPRTLVRSSNEGIFGITPLMTAMNYERTRANHAAILRCLEDNAAAYPALLNRNTAKCCLVRLKQEGMTDFVAAREINELTRPQFVFMVLDMMKNCAMEPLAEEVMSYVGTNVGL